MANSIAQTIREAEIDARSLSEFISKGASFKVTRRLAPKVHTLDYYLNKFDSTINQITTDGTAQIAIAISNAGFIPVGTFAGGATLSKPNDVLKASDGKLYRWAGSLPKTVPASSTPENNGGFGADAWIEVSDASLSQKLAGLGGASTIGSGVSVFNNMAEFLAAESKIKDGSKVFLHSFYQGLDLEGEGRVYTYSKSNPKAINQATGSGYLSRDFDGKVFIAEFGAIKGSLTDYSSETVTSAAMQSCLDIIRANDGGILSMGKNCIYNLAGVMQAEVSNFHWEVNSSTLVLGLFGLKWEPKNFGYSSYENVHINNGIWVGNSYESVDRRGVVFGGGFHNSMCKIDGLYVRNNKFIECNFSHLLDLMGCRDVYFENNEVLGSSNNAPAYTEAIQLSRATKVSYGSVLFDPSNEQYFDEVPTQNVYIRNNIWKPYENPVTGITSYPTRPCGDHGIHPNVKNICFESNHVENVKKLDDIKYRNAMINIMAYNVSFKNNTFISTNGNFLLARIVGYSNYIAETEGFTPYWDVSGNSFSVESTVDTLSETAFLFTYQPHVDKTTNTEQGYEFRFNNNTINCKSYTVSSGIPIIGFIYIDDVVERGNTEICKNKFNVSGNIENVITFSKGIGGFRSAGTTVIQDNEFLGSINSYCIRTHQDSKIQPGQGNTYNIINNNFVSQVGIISMYANNVVVVKDNVINGWPAVNYDNQLWLGGMIHIPRGAPWFFSNNLALTPLQEEIYTTQGFPRNALNGLPSWVDTSGDNIRVEEVSTLKLTYKDGSAIT